MGKLEKEVALHLVRPSQRGEGPVECAMRHVSATPGRGRPEGAATLFCTFLHPVLMLGSTKRTAPSDIDLRPPSVVVSREQPLSSVRFYIQS